MAFQPSADSCGIRRLGFKCSWWQRRQANDVVASEPSIFRRGHNFIGVAMQPEALVAATLVVSQERKSFTTNHTSILKIVRFYEQNVPQFDA